MAMSITSSTKRKESKLHRLWVCDVSSHNCKRALVDGVSSKGQANNVQGYLHYADD